MPMESIKIALALAICVLSSSVVWAFENAQNSGVKAVGIIEAAPFAMKDIDGKWEGIAVDLWRHVAVDLGLGFEFSEMPIPELITTLQQGQLLAVVTATASAERELTLDFSHPYYTSGLAIAVPVKAGGGNWFEPLGYVVSEGNIKIVSVLLCLLLFAPILVWLSEHKANPVQFSNKPLQGIAEGIWWAVVTLTTTGYGDKVPLTRTGRVIGIIWMFSAVILIALFTAQVTSSLTVTRLSTRVRGPADLVYVKVGAIQDSQPQALLRKKFGVVAKGYPGFNEGFEALERGDIDAFVAVEPVLRYEIANNFAGRLAVVGSPFLRADYVFAFPLNSEIRKRVNKSILSYIETEEWRNTIRQYLGDTQ